MRFAVGYQLSDPGEEPFAALVEDYAEHLAEIYFPWVGTASGRAALGRQRGATDWTAQARLEEDLRACRRLGLKLDLLLNANCYGARAASEALQNEVGSLLDHLGEAVGGVDIVTTTSLAVARTVKHYFPGVEVRASVNMRIGSPEAFLPVAGLFDSFYLQRDRQRDLEAVRAVHAWCDEAGKGLCLLANSGCLYCCPGQTFHDNLVAHDAAVDEMRNIPDWTPHVCWHHYRERAHWQSILQSTWIRPEDLHHYEGLARVVKLATRMHTKPRMVLHAYTSGRWEGNLLDLLEPGFSTAFAPHYLDNSAFPEDWFARTSTCAHRCTTCRYCGQVLETILKRGDDDVVVDP